MRKVLACMLGLALLAAACSSPKGTVTGKEFTPAHTAIEFFGCGITFDGSGFDCGSAKPKMVFHGDEWRLFTTDGSVHVGPGLYNACDVGDWYEDGRCYDERPVK